MHSSKWTSRGITLLLAVIMVLQLVPKQLFVRAESVQLIQENPIVQTNNENQTISGTSADVIGEITEKRTENVKYFRMSDGSYTAAQYTYDVHYKTDTGYEEYDNTLKEAKLGKVGSMYVPTKSDMQIAFAKDSIGNGVFQFGGADYSIQVALVELPNVEIMSANSAVILNQQVTATLQTKPIGQYANKLEELTDLGKTVSGLSYANVLPNTTLDYVLFGNNIKESIILSAPTTQNSWRFKLTLDGVNALLQENGDVHFVKDGSNEIACIIPKGYMFDAEYRHSDGVTYSLTPCTDGVYLTVQADREWLSDASRVYPVTIDPTFWQGNTVNTTVKDAHVIQGNPDTNTRWYSILRTGYASDTSTKNMRIYLKWNTLPALPNSAEITDARIGITQVSSGQWYSYTSSKNYMHIGAYKVLSSWDDSTITWNNQPSIETNPMDYITVTAGTEGKKFYFDVTTAAKEWYENGSLQQGIVLHAEPETWNGHVGFHSGNDATVSNTGRPTIMISYRDTRGLENIWSYDVEDVGVAGTGYVNLFNGNLVLVQPGMTTAGNILPIQVGLVYNDFQKGMQFNANDTNVHAPYTVSTPVKTGYGWKLNILETIKPRNSISNLTSNNEWLVYNDGNGTEIYFQDYIEIDLQDKYQSEDGHPLTLTKTSSGYVMEDDQHNKKYFDSTGRLFAIEDFTGNRKEIEFNAAGYPTKIIYLPAGDSEHLTDFLFEYNSNGALVKVINGRDTTKYMEYLYADTYNGTAQSGASNYLVGVRYSTGEEATYGYGSNSALIRIQDHTHKNEVWYSYGNNRVTDIEVTGDNGSLEDERYITYQNQKTTVRTRGSDDMPLTDDDYLNVYLFDEYGRAVNVYITNLSGEIIYGTGYTEYNNGNTMEDIRKQNTVASQTSSGNIAQNLVRNGNAESSMLWTSSVTNGGTASAVTEAYYGEHALSIYFPTATPGTGTWTQSIYQVQQSGTYTLSAYVKTADITAYGETSGVKILLDDQSSLCRTGFSNLELGWERLVVSRHYNAGDTITVTLKMENSSGIAYFDGIQLEKGVSASAYNLIDDGGFEYLSTAWDILSGSGSNLGAFGKTGNGVFIPGNLDSQNLLPQNVSLNQPTTGIAIVVSGWAKGKSAARKSSANFSGNSGYARENRYFALQVVLNYSEGEPETHYLDFSPALWNEWQFVAKAIHPSITKGIVTSVTVSPYVGFNKCDAYFDNISVTVEPTAVYSYNSNGYVTSAGESSGNSQHMEYTADNQLSSYQQYTNDEAYTYEYYEPGHAFQYQLEKVWSPSGVRVSLEDYDDYGNLLEQHTYAHIGNSEIIDTYTYDYYGNFLQTETTSHGTTVYDYNEATGLLNYVQNANQNRTGYVYDASGKLTAVFLDQDKDSNRDSDEQAVRYVYDSQNRLVRIITQGTSYNFNYNNYDQVTSITLGTSQILLVTYTYNARGGKLIRTEYGDGTYIINTYDDQGRIVEVSYNGTKAYTVVYDGNGNVYSYKEEASGHHYLYDYDNIGRIRQYRIMSNNECILLVSYVYQADGRIQSVSREYGTIYDFTEYKYNEYGQLEEIYTGLNSRLLFTYDALDRLSKKTVNYGNSQVDTEYTYWTDGNYTSNRITSIKYKTDSQTLKNIQYEYDNLGNITRINDGTETRLYTYDALNQLTSEIIYTNSTGIGTKATYTYDKAGNIVNKTHSVYNNGTVSNSTTTSYTYDEYWRGLLTGYDGEGITYDAIGNPLSYYNGKRYTFSWLYGRRLASIVVDGKTNTYTYNTEGLRLTKTVNGVVHTYYWDGSTLLMEKWGNSYLRFTYDESGAPLRVEYYNGSATTVYYYVLNLQGDVLEIRDTANNVVYRYSYDAWGKLLSIKDGSGNAITSASHIGILNPLRYRGYYYDTETGLYYLQSRYYDPQVGRFVSADAYISTGQGILGYNMYAYCGNNPVNRIDPRGNNWVDFVKEHINVLWEKIRTTIRIVSKFLLQKIEALRLEQQKYAATVYAEAGGQNIKTKKAIAHVINNRIGTKINWTNAVDVISASRQFAGYNNRMYNDAMEYYTSGKWDNTIERRAMDECMTAVVEIYNGAEDITGGALYFHSHEKPEMWEHHEYYTQIYINGTEDFYFYK